MQQNRFSRSIEIHEKVIGAFITHALLIGGIIDLLFTRTILVIFITLTNYYHKKILRAFLLEG